MTTQPHTKQQTGDSAGPLFSEFPATAYDEWRQAVEKVLKGAPFDKKLITQTYEGIALQPLYQQEDIAALPHLESLPGFAPYVRATDPLGQVQQPWTVCQELLNATPEAFNQALRADLERGQTAVNMVLDKATCAGLDADRAAAEMIGQGGLSLASVEDLRRALDSVDLEEIPIFIQSGSLALPATVLLMALMRQLGKPTDGLRGCIGADPLGAWVEQGSLPLPLERAYDSLAKATAWTSAHAPRLQTMLVCGHPYHNGGAHTVQELAFTLATAVEYIRALQDRGLAIDSIATRIRFAFSIGSNVFMEIARLRAARLLWAKIVKAFGGDEAAQKMSIHGRTSTWNKTLCDPYVNMLRTTAEAFAGAVGGCNSLHVGPFDEVARTPDEFSRRIARNTHTVLREESHLARTVDPAGGSWYVESLTDAVARQTWSLFQQVERQGGLYAALRTGFPQAHVAETASQRAADAARRRAVFVGTNLYPNLKEKSLDRPALDHPALQRDRTAQLKAYRASVDSDWHQSTLAKLSQGGDNIVEAAIQAASGGATLGDIAVVLGVGENVAVRIAPIARQRGAEPFEALRQAAESFQASHGERPKVFLANMGPLRQHKARADFARGFLEVGGFAVLGDGAFATPAEAAQAAIASGAAVTVICSTDDTYPELAPPLVQAIKQARPDMSVLIAGRPADQVDALRQAGVEDFIYLGGNCYDLLLTLQKKIGVVA
ncbi:MAG: acyl-CoA mutase large subunit family protein [Gammaproteobacteria bacterium]|nr:acyl-CoA mutase large subunit family protein [Gammaproteobacteria bacterium]MCP5425830.1 acyl-CoA mutase large subunit family protein [Gammaproteobacteria bacterium]MCP5458560.1 acyl-CoA mutase large subunit family protein [Gammaproteobacteria bacterium]